MIPTSSEAQKYQLQHQSHTKDIISTATNSYANLGAQDDFYSTQTTLASVRAIFEGRDRQESLSPKMTQRAVVWLLTVGWSKNCSQQSVWTALLLFYGYKSKEMIEKSDLELILGVCLQLATKVHETVPLRASELLLSLGKPIDRSVWENIEQKILETFEFNLYFPHALSNLARESLEEQILFKTYFLAELYLCGDLSLFFSFHKVRELAEVAAGKPAESVRPGLRSEIGKLVADQSRRIILTKYSSKFDLDHFLLNFKQP